MNNDRSINNLASNIRSTSNADSQSLFKSNNLTIFPTNTSSKLLIGSSSTPATHDLQVEGSLKCSAITGNLTGNVTGNADTSTKILSITNSDIVQLTESQTLTNKSLTSPTITGSGNITANFITGTILQSTNNSGYGAIEIGGLSGGFLDLKSPSTDDYDLRLIHYSNGDNILTSITGFKIQTGSGTIASALDALNIDGSQNATFSGNVSAQTITTTNILNNDATFSIKEKNDNSIMTISTEATSSTTSNSNIKLDQANSKMTLGVGNGYRKFIINESNRFEFEGSSVNLSLYNTTGNTDQHYTQILNNVGSFTIQNLSDDRSSAFTPFILNRKSNSYLTSNVSFSLENQFKISDTGNNDKFVFDIATSSLSCAAFIGDLTGNADTATKIASITNSNIVQLTTVQTLTNKTLTSPTITGTGSIAGAFTGDITGDLTGNADTATKINSITNSNIVQLTETQTLTNKSLTSPTITGTGSIAGTFTGDVTGDVTGNADTATKISSITNSDIVQLTASQTLTNKTLTSPTINGTGTIAGTFTGDITGDLTGNADTSTKIATITNSNIVQLTASQTLTNKTLTSPTINGNGNITANSITGTQLLTTNGTTIAEDHIEVGIGRTSDGFSYIDLHSVHSSPQGDYNSRIFRASGINNDLDIYNAGTGSINFKPNNGASVVSISSAGHLSAPTIAGSLSGCTGYPASSLVGTIAASQIVASAVSKWTFSPNASGDIYFGSNVGIGVANPNSALHVIGVKNSNPPTRGVHIGEDTNGNNSIEIVQDENGAVGYVDFTKQSVDFKGRILYDHAAGAMSFQTTPPGGVAAEVMRLETRTITSYLGGGIQPITGSIVGTLGLGVTSPNYQLELSTDSAAKLTTDLWAVTSDKRIKKNIQSTTKQELYNIAEKFNVRKYEYIDELQKYMECRSGDHYGLIADEIQEYFPDAVNETKYSYIFGYDEKKKPIYKTIEDCKRLQTGELKNILLGCIPHLIQDNAELKNKISILESEITTLRNMITTELTMIKKRFKILENQ